MNKPRQHSIDFLFSLLLFFIFAIFSVVILLFSAHIYQSVTETSEQQFETGTALSYLTEKIRYHEKAGNVNICDFQGNEALALTETYGDETYTTYIYGTNGELKEVFLLEGTSVSADSGTTIMEIGSLEMTKVSENLFRFTCVSKNGISASVHIFVHP